MPFDAQERCHELDNAKVGGYNGTTATVSAYDREPEYTHLHFLITGTHILPISSLLYRQCLMRV